jgi:hypothetical protein
MSSKSDLGFADEDRRIDRNVRRLVESSGSPCKICIEPLMAMAAGFWAVASAFCARQTSPHWTARLGGMAGVLQIHVGDIVDKTAASHELRHTRYKQCKTRLTRIVCRVFGLIVIDAVWRRLHGLKHG